MRKLSMKKFGTPIGAGPGSEKEKVGFVAVGTPVLVRSGVDGFLVRLAGGGVALPTVLLLLSLVCFGVGPATDLAWRLVDGCCGLPGPLPCGGPWVEVLVDVVVVVTAPVAPAVVVVVVVVPVVVVEAQLSVTVWIGPVGTPVVGIAIEDSGVPGGTSTEKENVCPVSSVTSRTHCWAEAVGSQAIAPMALATVPAEAKTSNSFRLLNTVAYLLPRTGSLSKTSLPPRHGGVRRTLLIDAELCNGEPFLGRSVSY